MLEVLGRLIEPVSRLLSAILFFLIALAAAEILKAITVKLLRKCRAEEKLRKLGMEDGKSGNPVDTIGKIVYFAVLLLVLPSVLDLVGLTSVSDPINSMMVEIFHYIPKILAAILIVVFGVVIARIASAVLNVLLVSIGTDRLLEKSGCHPEIPLSGWISAIAKYVILAAALAEAANALALSVLSRIGEMAIHYIPYAVAAAFLFGAAYFAASFAAEKVKTVWPENPAWARAVKAAIVAAGSFAALGQLQIAPELVNSLLLMCVGAVAAAFALAFGLGGQEFAARTLNQLEKKLSQKTEQKEEQKEDNTD